MSTRIVLRDMHLQEIRRLVFDQPGVEGAAFILCGENRCGDEIKLISHAVIPVAAEDYLAREPLRLSIASRALMRITKLAAYEQLSIVFAHSHPGGFCDFSEQDDNEEEKLIPFLQSRVPNRIHGTIVVTERNVCGRLFAPSRRDVDVILSVGAFIQAIRIPKSEALEFHDRQVRAFGAETQSILSHLKVAIVGLGGTGSPLAEQLYRLGVGRLQLFDGDELDGTNLNRVYGARKQDVGRSKAELCRNRLLEIGLSPEVTAIPYSINLEQYAKLLASNDIVFGCTDKQIPRGILTKLALQYCIPVFDLGVLIDSKGGSIKGVVGRVTTLQPGESCLFCRGRISPEAMRVEALSPEDRAAQVKAGYAPELEGPAPAVIPFTSAIASLAVSELLHRLTGYMGKERLSSEVLACFDESKLRTNRVPPREECMCSTESIFCRGDEVPFLGLAWASPPR